MMWIIRVKSMNFFKTQKKCPPMTYKLDTSILPESFDACISDRFSPYERRAIGAMVLNHPNSNIHIFSTTITTDM